MAAAESVEHVRGSSALASAAANAGSGELAPANAVARRRDHKAWGSSAPVAAANTGSGELAPATTVALEALIGVQGRGREP